MKKVILVLCSILFITVPFFAEEAEESSDWKESGKSLLDAAGKFIKDTGKSIEKSIDEHTEVKCYGTWVSKTANVTTTFICNEDGTMEISKKVGGETDYWKGTYSSGIRMLTFTVTEAGRKSLFSKSANNSDINSVWFITYTVQEEEKAIKIFSDYIPTDIDGNTYTKGVIFTKKD